MIGIPGTSTKLNSDTLIIPAPWDAGSADPHFSEWLHQEMGVIEKLVDGDPNGSLIPGLATSWDLSDDQNTWTFHMRNGINFSMGPLFLPGRSKYHLNTLL